MLHANKRPRWPKIAHLVSEAPSKKDALGYVVSDKKYFLRFSYIILCKTEQPRVGPFMVRGHYLNKLGRGPLGEATYPI